MQPARVAQGGHKQMHPHPLTADPHPRVAKVDLHLLARGRLKPHGCPHLRLQLPAPALDLLRFCGERFGSYPASLSN